MPDFEEQLNELRIITKSFKIKDLSKALGVSPATIRTWRSRNKIPDEVYSKAHLSQEGYNSTEPTPHKKQNETKILPFEYIGGKAFTEKLVFATESSNFLQLAESFAIPRSTISTWHTRNMTPFEIAVRVHLAKGVSLRWLLLDEGEAFETSPVESPAKLVIEKITNGILDKSGEISLDKVKMERNGLTQTCTRVIDLDGTLLFVNTKETKAISGRYLLDIDGAISINHLQRLPGEKLAMSYGNTSVEVAEADIVVLGRVVLAMEKE